MEVSHSLIFFFLLSLRDGNAGLFSADIPILTVKEGGNIKHACSFSIFGKTKIFCKEECEERDNLVDTDEDQAQRGRYSIEYKKGTSLLSSSILYVSITNLSKSDSGRYKCHLKRDIFPDSSVDFEIRVEDVPSVSTPTTTQSSSSSPGRSTPSSTSPETTSQPEQQQPTSAAGVLLYVGVTLGVLIVVLSAAVLMVCRRRASKPKDPHVENEYANVTKANRVYEEDGQSGSPPTVYLYANYSKPHAAETTDDHSSATAANFQRNTEDASSGLIYSQVNFSISAAALLNSAPCGNAATAIYLVPQRKTHRKRRDTRPL